MGTLDGPGGQIDIKHPCAGAVDSNKVGVRRKDESGYGKRDYGCARGGAVSAVTGYAETHH